MTVRNFYRTVKCPRCQAVVKIHIEGLVGRVGIECVCRQRLVWDGFSKRIVYQQYAYVKAPRATDKEDRKYRADKADTILNKPSIG